MEPLTNDEANSQLGLASRDLAFKLIEEVGGKSWKYREDGVTRLQTSLYHYGKAIAYFKPEPPLPPCYFQQVVLPSERD